MKKQNLFLSIDGENISSKKAPQIMRVARSQGILYEGKVYGLQKDPRTRGWSEAAKRYDLKDIRMYGKPEKNKVDHKAQKDAVNEMLNHRNLDICVLATSDGGYTSTILDLRSQGKKVVVIGEAKAPQRLREASSLFIEI